jgi:(S)-sulfolactate dehydrogenase
MKILIPEFMDPAAVAQLTARHQVVYDAQLVDEPARLLLEATDADAIIVRNRTQVRGELLAALARCRVVGRLGVGLDNIDLQACEKRNIRVIPATGANAQSVAEYVIAAALMLLRGSYFSTSSVADGRWPRQALSQGREFCGKTLGLIGFGGIGQLTGRLAQALGVRVVVHDPALKPNSPVIADAHVEWLALDELVQTSDVASLHLPLTPETRNLFGADRIARMKKGAVLVNTARGGIVDEHAVAAALRGGHLGGAALDVFADEPLQPATHFQGCPNLILTPHVAGVTSESNERVSTLVASRVLEELR